MSRCVALCDGFGGKVGKVTDREQDSEIRADFGKHPQGGSFGRCHRRDLPLSTGSKAKQEKMRWVANAPTSRFTSDGNADRVGVFGGFTLGFYRVGC